MAIDRKREEHHLLKTYSIKGIHARWFLIRSSFYLIELVEKNQLWEKFNQKQQLTAKCFIQLDIISKMMMYSEDLAAFSWAFLNNKSFYDILDEINLDANEDLDDLGKKIKGFYESIHTLSDNQIFKMMNYASERNLTDLDEKFRKLITHNLKCRAEQIRRTLNMVSIFGKTNHPFHKRFKHAVLPIFIDTKIEFEQAYMRNAETYSIAYIEKSEPFLNPRVIPFSNDVLESYRVLCKDMDALLNELVSNKIQCLERGIQGVIPFNEFDNTIFSPEEHIVWQKYITEFYESHERKYFLDPPNQDISIEREDYGWYAILNDLNQKNRSKDVTD